MCRSCLCDLVWEVGGWGLKGFKQGREGWSQICIFESSLWGSVEKATPERPLEDNSMIARPG